jgi:tripartite-type tricarboxylate transporter receptor subunit TctC
MTVAPAKAGLAFARYAGTVLCGLAAMAGTAPAFAQSRDFPTRAIRVVVPAPPGGIVDVVTRIVAQRLTETLGQTVLIDNRGGASTNIGTEIVARAPADGYTLLSNSLPLVVNPSLFPKLPFSVEKDFAPVSLLASAPYLVVTHPSVPARSIRDLVALARSKPSTVTYSSAGNGTNLHVAAELFATLTGVKLVHVPYKGGGPALTAVLGGETDVSFLAVPAVVQHLGTGRLRALAITSPQRAAVLPQLPTVAESGVPDYEFSSWVGILAPTGTPPAIVSRLHEAIVAAMRTPAVSERFATEGAEVVASSPAAFATLIRSDLARWAKVVKQSGMQAN